MGERKSRRGEKRHITSNNMKMSLREGPKKGLFYLAASAKNRLALYQEKNPHNPVLKALAPYIMNDISRLPNF